MTDPITIRVMVEESWDYQVMEVSADTSVSDVKRRALEQSRAGRAKDAYEVKFRGALVRDESQSLSSLGVVPNAQLIVLANRRQPVR